MRKIVLPLALLLPLALDARPARAQTPADTAAILGTVQGLFDAMAARDSVALKSIVTTDGRFVVVVPDGDSVLVRGADHAAFVSSIGSPGPALLERMWQPRVMIDGPIAAVWTPYDFHVGGEFSHCGVDVFTLARTDDGWRITGASYSIVRSGCAPSPLGEPTHD